MALAPWGAACRRAGRSRQLLAVLAAVAFASLSVSASTPDTVTVCKLARTDDIVAHGGGLNRCGCHFNRKTGGCHCHQPSACGCECQPATCK